MPVLLVQSCSASKQQPSTAVPALDLYTGYFYKIIEKSRREGVLRDDISIRILSAEHGLLHPETEIGYYDRRMTAKRAAELCDAVIEEITAVVERKDIDRVIINAGADYLPAVSGLETAISDGIDICYIDGQGIGEMGSQLKSLIRTDEPTKPAISA